MKASRSHRRAFVVSALVAALYLGLLGGAVALSYSLGFDLGASGFLLVIALLALVAAPIAFGRYLAARMRVGRPHPIGFGVLAGGALSLVVPVTIRALLAADGGPGTAVVGALMTSMLVWMTAVAAGAGAHLGLDRGGWRSLFAPTKPSDPS